jgi:hypothetical protein
VTGLSSNELTDELAVFLVNGLAIVVETRDALRQPEIARLGGGRVGSVFGEGVGQRCAGGADACEIGTERRLIATSFPGGELAA